MRERLAAIRLRSRPAVSVGADAPDIIAMDGGCGTGDGGFKPGNSCGKGGGGGGGGKSSSSGGGGSNDTSKPSYSGKPTGSKLVTVAPSGQLKIKTPKTRAEATELVGAVNKIHDQASADWDAVKDFPANNPDKVKANLRLAHVTQQLQRASAVSRPFLDTNLSRQQKQPGLRTLCCSPQCNGPWSPTGHSLSPPTLTAKLIGPAKRVDPVTGKSLMRLVKDVLRVGRWAIDRDPKTGELIYWDVTPATLRTLAANFRLAQSRGVASNIGKTHGNGMMIHPDDLISPIDQVVVDDGTLWISTYVDDSQRNYLLNSARKVSIGAQDNYIDGAGNVYSLAMIHVAVTDQPVMGGQGPWLAMAADNLNSNPSIKGTSNMDFAALKAAIDALMAAAGLNPLPDDTSEENLVERLVGVTAVIGGAVEETTETEDDTDAAMAETGAAVDSMDGFGGAGAEMGGGDKFLSNLLNGKTPKGLNLRPAERMLFGALKVMSNQLNALSSEKAANQRQAFETRLAELGAAGVPAATIAKAKVLGAQQNYNLSLLDLLTPSVNMKALSKGAANGSTPAVPQNAGSGSGITDEERKSRLEARGLKPVAFHRAS